MIFFPHLKTYIDLDLKIHRTLSSASKETFLDFLFVQGWVGAHSHRGRRTATDVVPPQEPPALFYNTVSRWPGADQLIRLGYLAG